MKKWALAAVLSLTALSSAWAAQTSMPMMDQAQHQQMMASMNKEMTHCQPVAMMSSSPQTFSQLSPHEKAAVALDFTPNGQSGPAHDVAKRHLAMIAG